MKKQIILLLVAIIAMNLSIVGQRQGNKPQMSPKARAEQMATNLNLSNDQKQQVQILFEEQLAKMKELKASPAGDDNTRREELKVLRKGWNQQLEGIIGKENMAKNKAMMAEKAKAAKATADEIK